MRTVNAALAALLLALSAPARAQDATSPPVVRHVPPPDAAAGAPVRLVADVLNGWRLTALEARWRPERGEWRTARFEKAPDGRWVARLDADVVRPPRLEYYLVAREEGQPDTTWFASAERPHPLLVLPTDEEVERHDRLLRFGGLTSRARLYGEYGAFGRHRADAAGNAYQDRWFQVEVDYLFRILTQISYIRLGYVGLRGDVPPPSAFDLALPQGDVERPAGVDYGFAEVGLELTDQAGLAGKLILGADDLGFVTGVGATLRLGAATRAHLEVGGQVIQRVGYDGFVAFHWDTIPRVPLALGLHVTNTPAGTLKPGTDPNLSISERTDAGAPPGVRFLLDAGYEATANLVFSARVGYQARVATSGGPTFGAGATVSW